MATINSRTELIDTLTTQTWYDVRKEIIDQVYQIRPFWDFLNSRGNIKAKVPDGTHFEVPVRYAKQDQNFQWFGKGATFGRASKESLTRLYFYVKNAGTSVVRYFDDEQKNKGAAKITSYVEELVWNTRESLVDALSAAVLDTAPAPDAIESLPSLISTTPLVGSVGGITRTTDAYLQNYIKDFTGLTTGTSLIDEMGTMYNKLCIYNGGAPDIIITERRVYQDFERICEALRVIQSNTSSRASLGFGDLLYKNTEIFWDPNCPAGNMYLLNTKFLEFLYDPDVWFEMTEWKTGPDEIDRTAQILCRCQFVCTKFLKQGVIYNITPTTS